ncbi:carboxypeptidase A1-like [Arapaima gigas]
MNIARRMRSSVIFCCLLSSVLSHKLFAGDQVLRITANSEEQLSYLEEQYKVVKGDLQQLDVWHEPVRGSPVMDVRVPFDALECTTAFLQAHSLQYEVMINDIQALVDEEKQAMVRSRQKEKATGSFDYGSYHTLEEINTWMDSLVAENPSLVSKMTIGQSFEKLNLYGGGKKITVLPPQIVEDYGQDPSVTALLDKMDVFFEIVVNPDGYVFTHASNRMWRKTRSTHAGSDCVGVDANRNFGVDFGGPGSTGDPCSETYHGPFVHSESEVKAIVDFILDHGNFKAMITIHSFSQMLMYPYGYTDKPVSNAGELHDLAERAVGALESLYGTKYTYGSMISTIYPASGTTADWGYSSGLKYSYTFELRDTGHYGFLLPAEQILPTAQETWLALLTIMEHVRDHPY